MDAVSKSEMSRIFFNLTAMNNLKENMFNMDELNELEMLEVKGGIDAQDVIQNQCVNQVAGCACSITIPERN